MTDQDTVEIELDVDGMEVQIGPQELMAKVAKEIYFTGEEALRFFDPDTTVDGPLEPEMESMKLVTVCLLVLVNGRIVVGTAYQQNGFEIDEELGQIYALHDAFENMIMIEEATNQLGLITTH